MIYEQVFADIVNDLTHLSGRSVNEDILDRTGEFSVRSLATNDNESDCEGSICSLLEALLGVQFSRGINITCTLGSVAEENGVIYLFLVSE